MITTTTGGADRNFGPPDNTSKLDSIVPVIIQGFSPLTVSLLVITAAETAISITITATRKATYSATCRSSP